MLTQRQPRLRFRQRWQTLRRIDRRLHRRPRLTRLTIGVRPTSSARHNAPLRSSRRAHRPRVHVEAVLAALHARHRESPIDPLEPLEHVHHGVVVSARPKELPHAIQHDFLALDRVLCGKARAIRGDAFTWLGHHGHLDREAERDLVHKAQIHVAGDGPVNVHQERELLVLPRAPGDLEVVENDANCGFCDCFELVGEALQLRMLAALAVRGNSNDFVEGWELRGRNRVGRDADVAGLCVDVAHTAGRLLHAVDAAGVL